MTSISNEFLINTTTAASQLDASVTVLVDGRFVVVWKDTSASFSAGYPYDDIRYQIFNADGSKNGIERIANTEREPGLESATYYQFQPDVTALANGGFAVTYRDNRSTTSVPFAISNELVVQRFDAAGNKVGSADTIMPAFDGSGFSVSPSEPSILGLSNGNYVVVNHTNNFPNAIAPVDDSGIVMQIFNSAGSQILGWTVVNSTTSSLQVDAKLAELSNGNFVVVWNSNTHLPFGWEVKAQVFTAAGVAVGGEVTFPSVDTAGQFTQPQVAALDNGRYVVTWVRPPSSEEFGQGLRDDIVARIVDANGNPVGNSDILVHTRDGLGQDNPVVAATADGTFLVVWQEGGETGGLPIRAQLFNADGTKSGSLLTLGSAAAPDDTDPRITVTKDGRFFIVWEDDSRNFAPTSNDELHGAFVDPRNAAVNFTGSSTSEQFVGTVFNDLLNGEGGADFLAGGRGNDVIQGGNGNDVLKGDENNDTIEGGQGADTMDGGTGSGDTLSYLTSTRGVTVNLLTNTFSGGHAQGDIAVGFENVTGSNLADFITGSNAANTLKGERGNDTLLGGIGRDTLIGGAGRDTMTGGASVDTFVFQSVLDSQNGNLADRITDFVSGADKIRLTAIDAIQGGGNDAFVFIGTASFSNVAGELRFSQDGVDTIISGDTNGDGAADFQIKLTGSITLTAVDFFL